MHSQHRRSAISIWIGLLIMSLCACSAIPRTDLGVPTTLAWRDRVDWPKAGAEAVAVLAGYLQVDTSNPPGNETLGARYLASILEREGIVSKVVEFAPGRGSLVARLSGSGKEPPLCLLSHIDVVPAEAGKWPKEHPPFAATIDADGMLWGRGALDMKGMGAVELMTLVWLKRLNVPLKRDIVLLAVADEEVGNLGMQQVVRELWPSIGCSAVVNEGGLGIRDAVSPGQTFFAVSVAEKGLLWLRMTAHGPAGHGSTPMPGRAPGKLLAAIAKLQAREPEPVMDPSLRNALAQLGWQLGGLDGFVLKRPALHGMFVVPKLMANPAARAGLTNTVNVTGFSGGTEPNVVPSEASAVLDCRLLPGVEPLVFLEELRVLVADPGITFEVLHSAKAAASPVDDPFYRALARHAVLDQPNAVAGPVLSVGYTDSILLRPLGVHAYGLVPFAVTQAEAMTMHGEGERVSVANIARGLKVLLGAVLDVAAVDAPMSGDPQ